MAFGANVTSYEEEVEQHINERVRDLIVDNYAEDGVIDADEITREQFDEVCAYADNTLNDWSVLKAGFQNFIADWQQAND